MKSSRPLKDSLFVKVLIAILLGSVLGVVLECVLNTVPSESVWSKIPFFIVRVLKTFNVVFAQLLKFIVPLLVLGLVTPSIANLGSGAGKLLLCVLAISYISTLCAGFFSFGCSNLVFPRILEPGEISPDRLSKARDISPLVELKIPPICDILTALVLSFMCGIGIIAVKANKLRNAFSEFGEIVKLTIERAMIPCIPFYIFTMMVEMSVRGEIAIIIGAGLKVIGTGIVISLIFLMIQYAIAGCISGKNPFKCLWNMAPAYFTAFSICSSSATIPITKACAVKNGVSEDIADFTIPLCSSVHMCGSTIKMAAIPVAVALLSGTEIPLAVYADFVLLQGVAAVAAPGVVGGVLMASVGLLESILGFSPEQIALVMTIYLAIDGDGAACNVTGDCAISLIIDRIFGRKENR